VTIKSVITRYPTHFPFIHRGGLRPPGGDEVAPYNHNIIYSITSNQNHATLFLTIHPNYGTLFHTQKAIEYIPQPFIPIMGHYSTHKKQ
jgi:hypothetical protein